MNKTITLSLILSSILSAGFINPLSAKYQYGIGAIIVGDNIDNSIYNNLVYKYGEDAKSNNVTLVDQILFGSGTELDKTLIIGTLEPIPAANNTCLGGFGGDPYVGNINCNDIFLGPSLNAGWKNLKKLNGDFNLWRNTGLENIDNLSNVTEINGWMSLPISTLKNINGLRSLRKTSGYIELYGSNFITNVDALSNLEEAYGFYS